MVCIDPVMFSLPPLMQKRGRVSYKKHTLYESIPAGIGVERDLDIYLHHENWNEIYGSLGYYHLNRCQELEHIIVTIGEPGHGGKH
jgi:hypothetical protein